MKDLLKGILGIAVFVIGIYIFLCFATLDEYVLYVLPITAVLGIASLMFFKDHELPSILQPIQLLLIVLGGVSYYTLFLILLGLAFVFIISKIFNL